VVRGELARPLGEEWAAIWIADLAKLSPPGALWHALRLWASPSVRGHLASVVGPSPQMDLNQQADAVANETAAVTPATDVLALALQRRIATEFAHMAGDGESLERAVERALIRLENFPKAIQIGRQQVRKRLEDLIRELWRKK
jgi:hypothetical protein